VIAGGAQRWHSGSAQVEAGAGATIAVNPGEVHDGEPIGAPERTWVMLYFDPDLIAEAANEVFPRPSGDFEIPSPVVADPAATATMLALFRAETEWCAGLERDELLLALVARVGGFKAVIARGTPASIILAREFIDDDPAADISLADLAAEAGLSRFQLLRSFCRATGMTPHAYMIQRRIDLVRRLIRGGSRLAEAAAAGGFADQSHMTRVFVQRYGLTPGAYARAVV